jgi:hypothetical protein
MNAHQLGEKEERKGSNDEGKSELGNFLSSSTTFISSMSDRCMCACGCEAYTLLRVAVEDHKSVATHRRFDLTLVT